MLVGRQRAAFLRPMVLLAVLISFSLAIRQGIAERSRPKLPPHSPISEIVAKVDADFNQLWQSIKTDSTPQADVLLVARRISLALVGGAILSLLLFGHVQFS